MEVMQLYFLSAQAHSINEMLWGRFLVGLGIGVNTVLVPLYISEVILQFLEVQASIAFNFFNSCTKWKYISPSIQYLSILMY